MAAWARAASASMWEKALRSEAAMAVSDASRASVGLRVLARKASTSEHASSSHGSVMVVTLPVWASGHRVNAAGCQAALLMARWPHGQLDQRSESSPAIWGAP